LIILKKLQFFIIFYSLLACEKNRIKDVWYFINKQKVSVNKQKDLTEEEWNKQITPLIIGK
jgi:hypothetical protein